MRPHHLTIAILAMTGLGAGLAQAADMPVKGMRSPPVMITNWNGFYAGLHAGGLWGKAEAADLAGWNAIGSAFKATTSGFIGGAQAGYNLQLPGAPLVVGIEGDLGYLGTKGSAVSPLAAGLGSGTTVSSRGNMYGTIRGRLGVAWDQVMLYGTGGLIAANVKSEITDNVTVPSMQTSNTGWQAGWIAGGGMEVALARGWSMKGEYLYFDLGSKIVSGTNTIGTFSWNIRNTGNIGRFGLNYRF